MTGRQGALGSQSKPIDYDASEGDAVTSPPTFYQPTGIEPNSRGRENGGSFRLEDQLYQRLLRERIIVLGTQVNDEIANRI